MSQNSLSIRYIEDSHLRANKIDNCECHSCKFIFDTLTNDDSLKFNNIIQRLQGHASWTVYDIIVSLLKLLISYRATKCMNVLIYISDSTFRESLKKEIFDAILKNNSSIRIQILKASEDNDMYMVKKLVSLFISSNDLTDFLRYIILYSSNFRETVYAITNQTRYSLKYDFILPQEFLLLANADSLRKYSTSLNTLCNVSTIVPSIIVDILIRNFVFDKRRYFMYIYSKNLVLPNIGKSMLSVCSDRYLLSNIFKYLDYY